MKPAFVFPLQILDELIIAGELQESSKKSVLRVVRDIAVLSRLRPDEALKVTQSDSVEEQEASDDMLSRIGSR
jgi:hypothetical protein